MADGWIKDGRAGDFLRADAALVGIVIGRKGKEANAGRGLDFHSFRHTYISNLERANVADGLRGQLSRATAQVVERYTHRELGRLTEEADRLPVPDLSALKTKPEKAPPPKQAADRASKSKGRSTRGSSARLMSDREMESAIDHHIDPLGGDEGD